MTYLRNEFSHGLGQLQTFSLDGQSARKRPFVPNAFAAC